VLTVPEIGAAVGGSMLDYHLHRLELAGLIELQHVARKELELGGADKI
jgi:hypothetical protein